MPRLIRSCFTFSQIDNIVITSSAPYQVTGKKASNNLLHSGTSGKMGAELPLRAQ